MGGRRGKPLRRKRGKLEERKRFLIYCEGEVTERIYFGAWKRQLRIPGVRLGTASGEPLGLVKAAISHQERALNCAEDQYMKYDHVWCVIDVEAPDPHPSINEALSLAKRNQVEVAASNPCFELWLALHLRAYHAYLTTDEVCAWLEQQGGCSYTRKRKLFDTEKIVSGYANAKDRAVRLAELHQQRGDSSDQNPSSAVWKLVEMLRMQVSDEATSR